jgi:hypothetical protein
MFGKLKFPKAALLVAVLSAASIANGQAPETKSPGPPTNAWPIRVIEDPSVRTGWRRYEIGASPTLSVILPSIPGGTLERVGANVINTHVSSNGSGVYAAVRVDQIPLNLEAASEEARNLYFSQFFQGFAKSFQKGLGPTIKDSLEFLDVTKVKTAAGRDGLQQRLRLGSTQGRAQMVFVGNSAFCVIAFWFPTAPAADYDSFFESFRITK